MFRTKDLWSDKRGTATIEYLIVLTLVTIGMAFAVLSLGPAVIALFDARALWLSLPWP